jgi:hypothetical protein
MSRLKNIILSGCFAAMITSQADHGGRAVLCFVLGFLFYVILEDLLPK